RFGVAGKSVVPRPRRHGAGRRNGWRLEPGVHVELKTTTEASRAAPTTVVTHEPEIGTPGGLAPPGGRAIWSEAHQPPPTSRTGPPAPDAQPCYERNNEGMGP